MTSTEWARGLPIAPDALPQVITDYLAAHYVRDLGAAMPLYAADASVTDEGHTYRGADGIRRWLSGAASEYTYTIELTSAARIDGDRFDALHHLAGDFPGGVADLHFRFTLHDGLIQRLVIEP